MNKPNNVVRDVAFLLSAVITAGLFGVFTAWGWSNLEPAQQELIGLIFANPIAMEQTEVVRVKSITVVGYTSTADSAPRAIPLALRRHEIARP